MKVEEPFHSPRTHMLTVQRVCSVVSCGSQFGATNTWHLSAPKGTIPLGLRVVHHQLASPSMTNATALWPQSVDTATR